MLRRGTIADAPRTKRFRERILAEGLDTIFKGKAPTLEAQEKWHRKFDDDPCSAMFLYLDGDEVVGLLGFESFSSTEQCRHAGSLGISVLGTHRGKGIGGQLLTALINWAESHAEIRRLELEVLSNNPRAKVLYERLGFEVEGVKRSAVRVGEGYVDSIVMTKWVGETPKSTPLKPVINLDELELKTFEGGPFRQAYADVGARIGAVRLGYNLTVLQPGDTGVPFHNHRLNEEMFLILRGAGTLRFGAKEFPIKAHDVVACPPGDRSVAHQIINSGDQELAFLGLSTLDECDVVDYPDSNKHGVFMKGLRHLFRADDSLDYLEGEG